MKTVLPRLAITLDPAKLSGRWYELLRTRGIPFQPDGMTDVCTEYVWQGRAMEIRNVALFRDKVLDWTATATPTDHTNARFDLRVNVPGAPVQQSVYRVLDVAADYSWLLVAGAETSNYVWLLARERVQTQPWWDERLNQLVTQFAVELGDLRTSIHTRDVPLCVGRPGVEPSKPASASVVRQYDGSYTIRM